MYIYVCVFYFLPIICCFLYFDIRYTFTSLMNHTVYIEFERLGNLSLSVCFLILNFPILVEM